MSSRRYIEPNLSHRADDRVYYNVVIPHLTDPNAPNTPSLARFTETRTDEIVPNIDLYYLSIIRFSIPGASIPLFVVPIQPGQADPNLTIFSVTLTFGVDNYQTFISWVPETTLAFTPVPPAPIPVQAETPYYYDQTYQHFLDLINSALSTSFDALKVAHPTAPPTQAPYFIYNPETQLISLIYQIGFTYVESDPNFIGIWINTPLQNYLQNFKYIQNGYDIALGKDYRFNLSPPILLPLQVGSLYNGLVPYSPKIITFNASQVAGGIAATTSVFYGNGVVGPSVGAIVNWLSGETASITSVTNPTTAVADRVQAVALGPAVMTLSGATDEFILTQEAQCLSYWNSFKNLVLNTGLVPVQVEFVQVNTNSLQFDSGSQNFRPILTDFEPELIHAHDEKSIIQYFVQSPYRLINLNGSGPLRKFDVQIYWQDSLNILRPLYINVRQEATIKFVFVKKSSYVSY